jgi:O-methyltransferase
MNLLKQAVKISLERIGYQLHPFNPEQVMPPEIPDGELYSGPEDYGRLFRPWRGKEYDRFFTPEILQNTMLSRQKLYFLLKLLKLTRELQGDILEAGVGSGGSARLILDSLASERSAKRMWLLDTFAGYKKIDWEKDGAHVRINQCQCNSKADVAQLLSNETVKIHLIEGLIPDTLAQVASDAFSFAHIDVNLYEPTLAATDFVLKRLVKGGVMLFDDYCWPATYSARRAIEEVCAHWKQEVICVPESTQAFLIRA